MKIKKKYKPHEVEYSQMVKEAIEEGRRLLKEKALKGEENDT